MDNTTILIADSDRTFSERLARFFEENGLQTSVRDDIGTALDQVAGGAFDIAVIEFCTAANRKKICDSLIRRPSTTEIILTCRSHTVEAERTARTLSPAFYFVKPVRAGDIYAVVLRIIEIKNRNVMLARRRRDQREGVCHG